MVGDRGHQYRETMQEILLEIKLKTINLFKKFREENRNKRVGTDEN